MTSAGKLAEIAATRNCGFSIRRKMSEIDKINELPEPDEVSGVHDDSLEYDAGFQAGKAGKPSDGKTVDWHRGWADAQE
jgi:hypothetical protein